MLRQFKLRGSPPGDTQPRSKARFGVALRLSVAFATVIGLGMLSTLLTTRAFDQTSARLEQIGERDIPALVDGMGLVVAAKSIVGELPRLTAARDQESLRAIGDAIDADLAALLDDGLEEAEQSLVGKLSEKTHELGNLKSAHLDLGERRKGSVENVHAQRLALIKSVTPIVDDLMFEMMLGSEDLLAGDDPAAGLDRLINSDVATLMALAELRAEANLAVGLLAQGAAIEELAEIVPIKERFTASADALRNALATLAEDMRGPIEPGALQIIAAGEGEESLFSLRQSEIEARRQTDRIVGELNLAVTEFVDGFEANAGKIRGGVETEIAGTRAEFARVKTELLGIAAFAVAIGVLIMVFYLWRGLTRRLTGLANDMSAIAQGNLDVEPNVKGSDEIASMACTVRQLRDTAKSAREMRYRLAEEFDQSLQTVIASVASNSRSVAESSQQLEAVAKDVRQRSEAVNGINATNLSNVQAVGSAAHQLTTSIEGITGQLTLGAETTKASVDAAERTSATVDKLIKASQDIDSVRQVISEIAEQTNLLALNATIEAARAGEQGRGFAVVAQEVKTLAAQTASATEDIAKRIQEVQLVTEDATQAIGVVVTSIQAVDESSQAIHQAISEQSKATESIAASVNDLEQNGREITDNVTSVAQSAQAASDSVAELNNLSNQLREHSVALTDSATAFVDGLREQS